MNLLLDVGNSRVKWRWESPTSRKTARSSSHAEAIAEIVADDGSPEQIAVAASGHEVWIQSFLSAAQDHWPAALIRRAATADRIGELVNSYAEPQKMGVDRWLAMLAARVPGRDVLVIDAGTAVTCDWIGHDGHHRGGWIIPGPALMRKALGRDTARVGKHAAGDYGADFGRSTASCVVTGTDQVVAAIVHRAAALVQRSARGFKMVVTGGDARLALVDATASNVDHVPELVLDGLSLWLSYENGQPC